jgi:hypothetical protein
MNNTANPIFKEYRYIVQYFFHQLYTIVLPFLSTPIVTGNGNNRTIVTMSSSSSTASSSSSSTVIRIQVLVTLRRMARTIGLYPAIAAHLSVLVTYLLPCLLDSQISIDLRVSLLLYY